MTTILGKRNFTQLLAGEEKSRTWDQFLGKPYEPKQAKWIPQEAKSKARAREHTPPPFVGETIVSDVATTGESEDGENGGGEGEGDGEAGGDGAADEDEEDDMSFSDEEDKIDPEEAERALERMMEAAEAAQKISVVNG